jgi:CRISPR-associated endonuclease Cas3-HD
MSAWLCPFFDQCPFREKAFCGHNTSKPLLLSYHPKPSGVPECYVRHIINCWNEWQKLEPKWANSVKRVLSSVTDIQINEEYFRKAMSLIVLHHDIGKLTEEYQNGNFIGHEALSAYLLYHQFREQRLEQNGSDLLAAIFASAVYLHHEALQISHDHFEMREPTYSYLLYWFSSKKFTMVNAFNDLITQMNQQFVPLSLSIVSLTSKPIKGTELARTLGSIMITIDGYSDPVVMRMGVATVLHSLTICDNLAANKRGGTPSGLSKALMSFFDDGAITVREE